MKSLSIVFTIFLFWSQGTVGENKPRSPGRRSSKASAAELRPYEFEKYRQLFLALAPETASSDATHQSAQDLLFGCGLNPFEADILIGLAVDYQTRSNSRDEQLEEVDDKRDKQGHYKRSPRRREARIQNDPLLASLVTFLPDYIGPLGATKVREQCLKRPEAGLRRQRTSDASSGQSIDAESDPALDPPEMSCGTAGGDYCSQGGSCPDGYTSLGSTYDCNPCCLSEPEPPPGPSCGELGGDYCSQAASCPNGYDFIGQSWDCNACCLTSDPGPSCGEVGGDYCSQNGSCPNGYSSLGGTYDCRPCCQLEPVPPLPPPPPPIPSCGGLGGDYCSQTGSCPEGYTWLGISSDCQSCCESIPQPPPPPEGPSCIELGGEYCPQSGVCPEGFISLGPSSDCDLCCEPDPDYLPPPRTCGELGGDYCSQDGWCPEGYESLGLSDDNCRPCCKSLHPTCGELGGDYCSESGWCPWAHESLGQTWDCNACCKSGSLPPPGATCGEIGGDYCSQNRFCPEGYESLGATEYCNPCCKSPPVAGPSCGELGGFYCSGGSFCPDGYVSLGPTSECTQCCGFPSPTPPPPPAPSNLFCSELGGERCGEGGACPEGYESIGETDDCTPCCVAETPLPLPEMEAGEACRIEGYSNASNEMSYKGHFIMIAVVNEHFRYWGIAEGHDGRANLLQRRGHDAPSICNLDARTCGGIDTGCGVPDDFMVCSGREGDPACSFGQYCDGSWTSAGYSPVADASSSSDAFFNPYQPMSERSVARAVSYTPVDCDCTDYREGRPGFYQAVSLNGEFRRDESAFQTLAQGVSNVGRIVAVAPPYVRVVVRVSYVCAGADGRVMGTVPIRSTVETP